MSIDPKFVELTADVKTTTQLAKMRIDRNSSNSQLMDLKIYS